jgi:hypothetical protein
VSGRATGDAFENSPYTGSVFLVHLAIADVVNDTCGNRFWMGNEALAKKARVSVSTAKAALATMVRDGWLERVSTGGGRGRHTEYRYVIGGPNVRSETSQSPAGSVDEAADETGQPQAGLPAEETGQSAAETGQSAAETGQSTDSHLLTNGKNSKVTTPGAFTPGVPTVTGKPSGGWGRIDASHALFADADAIATAAWEQSSPKPTIEYTQVRGIVALLLDRGWNGQAILAALLRTRAYSVNAITFELTNNRGPAGREVASRYESIVQKFRDEEGIA